MRFNKIFLDISHNYDLQRLNVNSLNKKSVIKFIIKVYNFIFQIMKS